VQSYAQIAHVFVDFIPLILPNSILQSGSSRRVAVNHIVSKTWTTLSLSRRSIHRRHQEYLYYTIKTIDMIDPFTYFVSALRWVALRELQSLPKSLYCSTGTIINLFLSGCAVCCVELLQKVIDISATQHTVQ